MKRPTEILHRKKSNTLVISFEDGVKAELPSEYLRCFSPSAEVKGHGEGQEKLQIGKENVFIDNIEPVGNYAVKLIFDDGHNTGLYSWDYLYELSVNHETNWNAYLEKLKKAGVNRKKN
ncbi:MAG: 1-(5-phosphoribosyl)-5-((5-phosphoribosylamino)methylideneamino)imidazole-4-carboxamide isomerase [Gammaproteobacteria bacterium]|nr:1-(5-phosphoribosyl)-5-((5-phosphoribosylamino)methylideneamino)imidazole-4-carboxamide isomerase [Gammaproteobacteria bacterium]|tara:strand:+ start:1626 stop:1982 length:357 start_codon:yes stop_codon:yes gene_type:complete